MGKRKRSNKKDNEEIRRKIRRLERRLNRHADSSHSDSDEYYESDRSHSTYQGIRSVVSIPIDTQSDKECGATSKMPTSDVLAPEILAPEIPAPEIPALSDDILEALGVSKTKIEIFAPMIREEVSQRWGQIVAEGLSKEALQKLMESIHIPENFKLLKAPELNAEMTTVLSESTKNRDKRLEKAQNHLGVGIAAITNLMSALIDGEMEKSDIIKKLSAAGQLLLDLHCQNTFSRRKLITFSLDKKFLSMIQGVKRDKLLFGDNLGEKIKANKTAEKSGFQIKRTFEPQPSTSYQSGQPIRQGNSRGPPKPQAQRGRRGGPRYPVSSQTYRDRRQPPTTTYRNNVSTKTNNNKPVPKN